MWYSRVTSERVIRISVTLGTVCVTGSWKAPSQVVTFLVLVAESVTITAVLLCAVHLALVFVKNSRMLFHSCGLWVVPEAVPRCVHFC